MAFNWFYERVASDIRDPDNETKRYPGFVVNIGERDGGIAIGTAPVSEYKKPDAWRYAFFSTDEAEELIAAIREAVRHAGKRPDGTPWQPKRVRDLPPTRE